MEDKDKIEKLALLIRKLLIQGQATSVIYDARIGLNRNQEEWWQDRQIEAEELFEV